MQFRLRLILETRNYLSSFDYFTKSHRIMAGAKHPRDDAKSESQSYSPYVPMFEGFRAELDEHHDRRERVIRISRDVTALSKKM